MLCSCLMVKKSSRKANYAAKYVPPFCEILFVYKGKHIWTRDALEELVALAESSNTVHRASPEFVQSNHHLDIRCTGIENWLQDESVYSELVAPCSANRYTETLFSPTHSSKCSGSSANGRALLDSDLRIEEENLNSQAEASSNEAFQELMKRRRLESEVMEVTNKVITTSIANLNYVRL